MTALTRLADFAESSRVQTAIMVVIVLNAVTLGLETSPDVMATFGTVLHVFDKIALAIFVAEIGAKLAGRGLQFFRNGWNVFDFIVVGIALLPATGPLAVLRALRVLRVLRLMSVVPQMRLVIQALISAIPGMVSIIGLILLIFYVSAVLATNFFAADFQEWFGSIGASMYTLFQIMTLESWSMGIVRPVMEQYPQAWLFFVPFILITSFAVINLFIGVIVDAMQVQHTEESREIQDHMDTDIKDLRQEISALRQDISTLKSLLTRSD